MGPPDQGDTHGGSLPGILPPAAPVTDTALQHPTRVGEDATVVVIDAGAATHAGAVRELNEDAVIVGSKIFAVADGMGGHAAGDVASAMTAEALLALDVADVLRPADLVSELLAISDTIARRADAEPERWGMGTTVTGLALVTVGGAQHWGIFNVGDSRVYHFVDGVLTRSTVDHSEVEELVTAGRITEAEARVHPDRNIITRSLGTMPAPQVDLWMVPPVEGERYLVCSDGLVNELEDAEIADVLATSPGNQEAVDRLMERALSRGARDNVTIVVVEVVAAPGPSSGGNGTVATVPRGQLGSGKE